MLATHRNKIFRQTLGLLIVSFISLPGYSQPAFSVPVGPDMERYLIWAAPPGYQSAHLYVDGSDIMIEAGPGEGVLVLTQIAWPTIDEMAWVRADISVSGLPAYVAVGALADDENGLTGEVAYHERLGANRNFPLVVGGSLLSQGYRVALQVRVDSRGESGASSAIVRISDMQIVYGQPGNEAPFATGFDGTFTQRPAQANFNINRDTGKISYEEKGFLSVTLEPQQAANVAVLLSDQRPLTIASAGADTAFRVSVVSELLEKSVGDESGVIVPEGRNLVGTCVVVLTNGNETLASYLNLSTERDRIGNSVTGNIIGPEETGWLIAAQLYTGQGSVIPLAALDNLELASVDASALPIQPQVVPTPTPEPTDANTEAILTLPNDTNVGSIFTVGLTTFAAKSLTPGSRHAKIVMHGNGIDPITLFEGATDERGHAEAKVQIPEIPSGIYEVVATLEGLNAPISARVQVREGAVLFIETDKPIYKPGQEIHGRLVSLNNSLQPLPQSVEITISDGKGIRIFRKTIETNADGVGVFELPLAGELNMGTWRIEAKAGDSHSRLDVQVDRYVLPRFEVSLDTAKKWFLVDEVIHGTIDANYFFGKPVQGTYRIEALRYQGSWNTYFTSNGPIVDGAAAVEIPKVEYVAGTYSGEADPSLQINLTVTDDAGHEESTSVLFDIVQAPMKLKMLPESKVIKPGLPLQVLAVTEDPDGRPLDADVQLTATYWDKEMNELGKKEERLSTERGLASFDLEVPVGTAAAMMSLTGSRDGHDTTASEILYAAASPSASFIHLRQHSEAEVQVGDTLEIEVLRTHAGSLYYDVVATGRTVQSGVVTDSMLAFTVTPEMAPKIRVLVYTINPNGEISADALPVEITGLPDTGLKATFDRDEVEPGDPVQVAIAAGRRSTVGVAVVDRSVFALAQGRLNMKQIFDRLEATFMEPKIELHNENDLFPEPVRTIGAGNVWDDLGMQVATSPRLNLALGEELDPWRFWFNPGVVKGLPFEVLRNFEDGAGVPAAGGGSGGGTEPTRVRQFFPETWVWQPLIATDEDGNASLALEAPDSITTWKLHAVANSATGIGITEDELTVFQPFFVEPDLPYAVIRGDEFPLLVQIYNYSETEKDVVVDLELPAGIELLDDSAVANISVPAQSVRGVSFKIRPTQVGMLTFQMNGRAGELSDAVRKPLRVEPEGATRQLVQNGILEGGKEATLNLQVRSETPIGIPEFEFREPDELVVPDSTYRRVAITPSYVGSVMENLGDLVGMPYGCGEQNMIFLAPDVEVLRYLRATNQNMPELQAQAELYVTIGYQRQLTYQRNDGSFSAFGSSDPEGSLWLSAFVLSTFAAARDVYQIDSSVLASCGQWIVSHQQPDGSWDNVGQLIHQELDGGLDGRYGLTAYVALALATYGGVDTTAMNKAKLYLELNYQDVADSPYGLALGATALDAIGGPIGDAIPVSDMILDRLLSLAVRDENGLHWNEQPVETTSYAVLALLGRNRPEAADCLRWLVSQRGALGGYGSTQDTVVAFKALTAAAMKQSRNLNAEIDVVINGEVIHTFMVNADNFDVLQTLELAPTVEEVTLRQRGEGSVTYQGSVKYNVYVPKTPPEEGPMLLSVEYLSDHIAVDDFVDVVVSIAYRGPAEKTGMAIVDVSVPTGFEAVQESLDALLQDERGSISRIELPGRKVVFYIDDLYQDEPLKFKFQVKALYPVKASGGTSQAYAYYDPEIRAEVDGGEMIVNE